VPIFVRSYAYRALGQKDKAIKDYKKAIELAPELAES
jgi:tetratricopeptide (TPR) repeat protein